jgi:hypothetical protein
MITNNTNALRAQYISIIVSIRRFHVVSSRIWVSCAVGDDAPQGIALVQRLISDLRNAGAEVVSENAALPDEQFLPFLQQELASCQWFVLVQTPQGMGSRRAQLAIEEALARLKEGSLRGACLVNALSDGWGEPAPGPEMRSYTYQGDYPRLRDKLLLDLGLLQLTSMLELEEVAGDKTIGMFPPVQETPGIWQRTATGSAERSATFPERGEAMYPLSAPFGSVRQASSITSPAQHLHKTTSGGDRPAPLRFTLPRPSRYFWLYSLMSILILIVIVSGAVLAKDISSASSSAAHPTPITVAPLSATPSATTRPTPTPSASVQPTPTASAPMQPAPTPQPTPTCGTTGLGPFSLAANTVYEWPGGAPWFVTSANCQNIKINMSKLTHPVQLQVCFISTGSCNAWQTVSSTGTWYQIATGVSGGTSYRFGIKTGGSATTMSANVSD